MCSSRRIRKRTGSIEVRFGKKTIRVPDIEYHQCEKCGEVLTDVENERRIDDYIARQRKRAA